MSGNANGSASNGSDRPIREVELSGKDAREKLAELLGRMSTGTDENKVKEHKFWNTQPVPQLNNEEEMNNLDDHGEAFETKTVDQVQKEPFALIEAFEWSNIDVQNDKQLEEVYRLLNENYVEDVESMFRFDYSREFLRWALLPPGWQPTWHVGVRVKASRKLVAFISAIPATVCIHKDCIKMVEINFLCVHKKLRSKRLAPVLIREITRRVNLLDIWQAAYTAGTVLPRPVSSSRYYHRSLNPKKLIDIGFSRLQPRMTMMRTIKLYALRPETFVEGIRPMVKEDIPQACAIFQKYLDQFDMHVQMTQDEFEHWMLPRENVVYTYVVENPESKLITDLVSYYSLPSSVIRHALHNTLHAAYAFCTAALSTSSVELMRDALILARRNGFDVFNALDLAQNSQFFRDLKFHVGDGQLNYYLYNWKCRPVPKDKNALVLL